MGTNYEKWLETEDSWAEEVDAKFKKSMVKWMVGLPIACVAGLFAIGWVSNGILAQGISNIKYGVLIGVAAFCMCLISYLCSAPGKSYKKSIRRYLDKELPSNSEKEEFAAQMLGQFGDGSVRRISQNEKGYKEGVIRVTKNYILNINPSGRLIQLVDLNKVEKIETDSYTTTQKVGNTRVRNQNYDIVFLYKMPDVAASGRKKRQKAVNMSFDARSVRDDLLDAVRAITAE